MTKKEEIKYLLLIVIIFIAACVETDIYLPAFPDMMQFFKVSEASIQGLLTWNFIGICASGPFYGPLSDAFGRKRPLMIALMLFLIGSILTVLAQSLDQMIMGRILQGIGSGGCFTLGTAIIFDSFQNQRAIHAVNQLNLIIPLGMSGAPLMGGYLNHAFGFRSNFLFITLFVFISLLLTSLFFKESLNEEKRVPFQVKKILGDFKKIFKSASFWQLTFMMSLTFGGYIAFLSGTAILFVVELGMSKAIFPFIQASILGGWVIGSLTLDRVIRSLGTTKVKRIGTVLAVIGCSFLLLTTLVTPQNPYLLTAGMVVYAFGANWMIGIYFPEGMEILPEIKGTAASVLTSARLFMTAVIVEFASAIYNATIYPIAFVTIGTVALSLPLLIMYERKKTKIEKSVSASVSEHIFH